LRPLKLKRLKATKKVVNKLLPVILIVAAFTLVAVFLTTLSGSSVISYIISGNQFKFVNGRVNILLLGIAGGAHDGASLTDTILVVSYHLKTNKVSLISIPRDLWLPAFSSKSNAIYEIGMLQKNGLGLAKTVMGNVVGLPVQYAIRLDFRGFVQAVDAVSGLDVRVDKSFDDYNYPIAGKENDLCGYQEKEMDFSQEEAQKLNITPGKQKVLIAPDGSIATDSAKEDKGAKYFTCRYEHLSFTAGVIHLDGDNALKFVRSRHGTNGEGSDFSRSKRQQKVLEAFRSKVLSFETLSDVSKISELLKSFGKSIDTDIPIKDVAELYKLSRKMVKISDIVLDDSVLYHPQASDYGGAYVLISRDDNFESLQQYVRTELLKLINENEASPSARTGNN